MHQFVSNWEASEPAIRAVDPPPLTRMYGPAARDLTGTHNRAAQNRPGSASWSKALGFRTCRLCLFAVKNSNFHHRGRVRRWVASLRFPLHDVAKLLCLAECWDAGR